MASTALFIGRFQPIHNGQLMVIKGMRRVCSRIMIGLGSPEATQSLENPFSAEERHEMISAALLEADITDADIVDLPDTDDDTHWVDAVLKVTGPIDTVWTGNEDVERLFIAKGIKVQKIKEVPGVSGTEVRRRMIEDDDWRELVPPSVASVLSRIEAKTRIHNLTK